MFLICSLLSSLLSGQSSRAVSSSPSIESLSGGRPQSTASPPLPPSRGSDVGTSSPPLSATKKESFFNISRSNSKTMGKKESVSSLPSVDVNARCLHGWASLLNLLFQLQPEVLPGFLDPLLTKPPFVTLCFCNRRRTWKLRYHSCRARSTI